MEFKIGDKVKVKKDTSASSSTLEGQVGIVTNVGCGDIYSLDIEEGKYKCGGLYERELTLVEDVKFKYQWKKGDKLKVVNVEFAGRNIQNGDIVTADNDVSTNKDDDICVDIINIKGEKKPDYYAKRFKLVEKVSKGTLGTFICDEEANVKGGNKEKKMQKRTLYHVTIIDRRNSEVIVDKNIAAQGSTTAILKALNGTKHSNKDIDHYHYATDVVTEFEVEEKECRSTCNTGKKD